VEIIDTHPHAFTRASEQYPHAPVGGEQSRWSRGIDVTGDDLRAVMDTAGVSQAVIVQTSTVYGYDNTFVADTVARGRGRFVGVCSVNPVAPSASDDLTYWICERGLSGVRLFTAGSEIGAIYALDDPRLTAFWECAASLGIPVDVQVKYPSLPAVAQIAKNYPSVPLIVDHIGGAPVEFGPPYTEAADLFALARYEQVHVKFSGHNLDKADSGPATARDFLAALAGSFGARRLVWGSNFPNTFGKREPTAETYRAMVNQGLSAIADLAPADQQAIMAGTPRTLYPLLKEAAQ
jgi:predicted TIM-barrel fold metal-dependent hydrolase